MKTKPTLVAVAFCLTTVSCTQTPTSNQSPQSTPATSVQATPATDVAGGFAPPEVGDTSAAEFSGATAPVEKKKPGAEAAILKEVRSGRHESFDRVVFEFVGAELPGYRVEYVNEPARSCGKGDVMEVVGQGDLLVQLMPAHAHNEQGQATITTRDSKPNLPVLKQMKLICDFEADVQWLLGIAKRNNFRVVELTSPARLVVDVKH